MRRENKDELKIDEIEFTNLKDWWEYLMTELPLASCIECEFAKTLDQEIRVGQLIYEPGDILCSYCPGIGTVVLGIRFPETCRLSDFNYNGNILSGKCVKLNIRHRILSSAKKRLIKNNKN
ncbi:MAG: hypothetical protein BWY48_00435 [Parcubacteria group bacterium ADurb.Bin305]|nr:MAG: hypothetical protein BWY48_00435 [Parcubacteria group bacterium ADurb.Bin305]